jgi:hypothetical protein
LSVPATAVRKFLAAAALLAGALSVCEAQVGRGGRSALVITNDSAADIGSIYIYPHGDGFGEDRLGQEILHSGSVHSFLVSAGVYDVRIVRAGRAVCVVEGVDLGQRVSWTVTTEWLDNCIRNTVQPVRYARRKTAPRPALAITNNSGVTLNYVYIYPGNDSPQDDRLGRDSMPSGTSYRFPVESGVYHVRLVETNRSVCEVSNVELRQTVTWTLTPEWLAGCVRDTPQPARIVRLTKKKGALQPGLDIANNTGQSINWIYIYPQNGEPREDRLGKATVLRSGDTQTFRVDRGVYQVRLVMFNRQVCDVGNVSIEGVVSWSLSADWMASCIRNTSQPIRTPGRAGRSAAGFVLTLDNQSHFKLLGVYIVPSARQGWGNNLGVLESGSSRQYTNLEGTEYRLKVEDIEGNRCEFSESVAANLSIQFSDNILAKCFATFYSK